MKKTILAAAFALMTVAMLLAQANGNWELIRLEDQDFPVASTDNLFAPLSNPSLLGTGLPYGMGWAHLVNNDKLQRHYWLFLNSEGLSYVYEYDRDSTGTSYNNHTLATGFEVLPRHVLPNLYAGVNYQWRNDAFGKGGFRSGLTWRPHNSTSLGFTWDNPYKASPSYRFGAALRPLAFLPSIQNYRLELSADFNYAKNPADYEFQKPVLGINTQVLDGLNIGASYNLENETAFVRFGLNFGETDLGSVGRVTENDNYAIPYIHLGEETFKPFLGLHGKNWYEMRLKGSVVSYRAPKYSLGPLKIYEKGTVSIDDLIARLKLAKDDPSIEGILLKNPSFATSFALQQELIAAFQDFKSTDKYVVFYFDNISNGGYIFASSIADKIYLNPMGSVDLRGLSITSPYLHDMLSYLGIEVYNFRSHKYKNAGNMLSESEMTEAEREVYDSILQSIYDQMVAMINSGRGDRLAASVEETIDNGPYFLAQDALDAGLVDELIYEDELSDDLDGEYTFSSTKKGLEDYRDYDWSYPREKLVAVIYASGNIVMGKGAPGQKIAHETTVDLIRAARKNKAYKGIILRVDSGGGSAQASDIILRELTLAQVEDRKPVVVSMAGVAGSGGYYIACKADRIIADPATITGSIGVIGLVLNPEQMFRKIKVNWSTVKKGENADFGSLYRSWTQDEKRKMEQVIEATYEDFVRKVDEGRIGLDREQVHQYAQGRIWTGEQAKEIDLIDDLGGLETAVQHMRELTGIKGKLRLVNATGSQEGMSIEIGSVPLMNSPQLELLNELSSDYIRVYELWKDFEDEPVLMLSPMAPQDLRF
jgi:protease-4